MDVTVVDGEIELIFEEIVAEELNEMERLDEQMEHDTLLQWDVEEVVEEGLEEEHTSKDEIEVGLEQMVKLYRRKRGRKGIDWKRCWMLLRELRRGLKVMGGGGARIK